MIFVTVGTHEQPFNRLIEEVDRLKKEGIITDDVFIQTGFSTYEPQWCDWKGIISYSNMEDYMTNADIIVTHGGPATFMGAIANGKKPIVVPRQEKFGEHVNDHQVEFAEVVKNRLGTIFTVTDISKLETLITLPQSDFVVDNSTNYNSHFVESFTREVTELLNGAE
ncbi:TPA: multidrug MFS transporter [Streptococcus suis]|uniref:Cps25G n=1 Tax=Streptococcus suis TaxID=1307 RepID=G8DUB4_STRSU|nr:glycosyltransferase [Streptococcus suis]AEH57615.1 Cps25G [Streptococcus suis]NQM09705.1 multidrug MFS transporter [Streptococcus suis]NQO00508.1 multidrug MFS transporter [Streptococcus suis]NQO04427.1 multidrug MFS transporter [Streptococcus suis]NQO30510.1 multidrug MFS transporter [Streptococcus suis]